MIYIKFLTLVLFSSGFLFILTRVKSQETELESESAQIRSPLCNSKENCSECIQTPECFWCSEPTWVDQDRAEMPRCNHKSSHVGPSRCGTQFVVSPQIELKYTSNRPLSRGDAILIQPQGADVKIRPLEPLDLQVRFVQYENQPIDLYFLMDLSHSMADDKEVLSGFGIDLTNSMRNITPDFLLGFGSFVDKVVSPFVINTQERLQNPCGNINLNCAAPYGFKNHLSLSKDTQLFFEKVKNAEISGNVDNPEGGFDGVMQSIVCEQIGWRDQARKIILYSTDSTFHIAGDGKLGGIIRPNDGRCHMSPGGLYTHSSILDYPSIAQVNAKVREQQVSLIFAVTKPHYEAYVNLSALIQGSKAGVLEADSSNLLSLLKEQYEQIVANFEIKHNAPHFIRIKFVSSCNGLPLGDRDICENMPLGNPVEFGVKIELLECPKDPKEWTQKFDIYRVGVNQNLTLTLKLQCDCPCERPGNPGYVEQSPDCSGSGTLSCGICECQSNFFGRKCECDGRATLLGLNGTLSEDRKFDPTKGCRREENSDIVCSNKGTCECGKCECHTRADPEERISGKYCECDNYSCERVGGRLCSGEEHGECVCGSCQCHSGWGGNACQCSTDESACYAVGSSEACSGHGRCICGKCECDTRDEVYRGKHCEVCINCEDKCNVYKDCVQCHAHDQGVASCVQQCNHTEPPIEYVDTIEKVDQYTEKYCTASMWDPDRNVDCRFYFVYKYDSEGALQLRVMRTRECPAKPPIFWIVFGIVAGVILIGLLLVFAYKLYHMHRDGIEYKSFAKGARDPKFGVTDNPIYKNATTEFKNPIYDK